MKILTFIIALVFAVSVFATEGAKAPSTTNVIAPAKVVVAKKAHVKKHAKKHVAKKAVVTAPVVAPVAK